ncbi:hypothetical protein OG321_34660 [Streptomyces sp. NBC_00424]|uniref:hypothetical protein n=1 Tax=Streptomyces sp. NBC_00424 TaxID=2903648 RepID=UPI002251FD0D|nr:hypothetical protein [Streptomyces sp. NBC_00424]MCX5077630.1 hypothetical protein [Streptomyces sp. NBC_00424]
MEQFGLETAVDPVSDLPIVLSLTLGPPNLGNIMVGDKLGASSRTMKCFVRETPAHQNHVWQRPDHSACLSESNVVREPEPVLDGLLRKENHRHVDTRV